MEEEEKENLLKKEAEKKAEIFSASFKTEKVTEINIQDDIIKVHHPEYNPEIVKIMRDLRLKWDKDNKYWQKKITIINGDIKDRVAEIANKLLLNDFPVRVFDEEIREKAIKGDYKLERWIAKVAAGEYINHFVVNFRESDLFKKARMISGSKYTNRNIFVPLESVDELIDFSYMYNFNFTRGAKELIEKANKLKEKRVFVNITKGKEEEILNTPTKLEIPENLEIDDEFIEKE